MMSKTILVRFGFSAARRKLMIFLDARINSRGRWTVELTSDDGDRPPREIEKPHINAIAAARSRNLPTSFTLGLAIRPQSNG
jgi:hypothetical protein